MANEKRLIDANELLNFVKGLKFHGGTKVRTQAGQEVLDIHLPHIVEKIPTVDAVEVVRCKDCKHCLETSASSTKIACSKGVNWRAVEPNHYCSYGERKDHEASQD